MIGTRHLCLERTDRAVFIFTTRGIGDPVAERKSFQSDNATMILTSTGVIIVKNDKGQVITMYYCTLEAAQWVVGKHYLPESVYNVIKKNIKKGYLKMQNEIKY